MKIVLVEWAGYPLMRQKVVAGHIVKCGLARILKSIDSCNAGSRFTVVVVVNCVDVVSDSVTRRMRRYAELKMKYSFIESLHFRDNEGLDIGAYEFGYRLLLGSGYKGDVLFMNSSVSGPNEDGWLEKYRKQFLLHDKVGLCGISINSHNTSRRPAVFAPHVQSFFLFSNMKILKRCLGSRFLGKAETCEKAEVIEQGEIRISTCILESGYAITAAMFPEFAYKHGDPWVIPMGDIRYSADFPHPNVIL